MDSLLLFRVSMGTVEETELDGNHLVVLCKINNSIMSHALIECSATGYVFIDQEFIATKYFLLYPLKQPRIIEVIDGYPIASREVTHLTKIRFTINGHTEELPAFIISLDYYPIVLGQP